MAGPQVQGRDPQIRASFQINRDYSFLDYILGGCQLMFTVRLTPPHPHPRAWAMAVAGGTGVDFRKDFPG